MKKILILLVLCTATFGMAFGQQKIQTIRVKTKIACDHCKMCGSCGTRIEKALYQQKGIKRVDVDDKKMEIVVVYNTEKITTEKIRTTITDNGYDADDQKASPESYAKLDDCCKGAE